jgi:hypothetical protein
MNIPNRNICLILFFCFFVSSFFLPLDIFNLKRDAVYQKSGLTIQEIFQSKKGADYVSTGFTKQLIYQYNFAAVTYHTLRMVVAYPFMMIAFHLPKLLFLSNWLVYFLFLPIFWVLRKEKLNYIYLILPFIMYALSFRSIIPCLGLAYLYVSRCRSVTVVPISLLFCFLSTSSLLLAILILLISRKFLFIKLLASGLILLAIFNVKGFYFGQHNHLLDQGDKSGLDTSTQVVDAHAFRKFSIVRLLSSVRVSILNSNLLSSLDLKNGRIAQRQYTEQYKSTIPYKMAAAIGCILLNIFLIAFFWWQRMFFQVRFLTIGLPFAFLMGYGYAAFVLCLLMAAIDAFKSYPPIARSLPPSMY